MTVRVSPDAEEHIRRGPSAVVVQVQQPSDPELAAEALERARPEIHQLATKGTSEVHRIPTGPFIVVYDRANLNERLLEVPQVVARHLQEAGLEATVACIRRAGVLSWAFGGLTPMPRAVVCRLFPSPPEIRDDPPVDVPEAWLGEAVGWLLEGLEDDLSLWADVAHVEFSLPANEALTFLDQQRRHRQRAILVAGRPRLPGAEALDPGRGRFDARMRIGVGSRVMEVERPPDQGQLGGRIRAAALGGIFQPHVVLMSGGPEVSDEELVEILERFKDICRQLAGELGYGYVDIRPVFSKFSSERYVGGAPGEHLELLCDEVVFDAYPYQVLGPGHLRRLGGIPAGASSLSNGRAELSIGDPTDWLIDSSALSPNGRLRNDKDIQESARVLLAPCIVNLGTAGRLEHERWERVKRRRLGLQDLDQPQYPSA